MRVVDRLKDVVITGGVNVSPTEVEASSCVIPTSRTCASSVCPTTSGASASSRSSCRADADDPPTLDELRAFAREQLAAAKLPREVRAGRPMSRGRRAASRCAACYASASRRQLIDPRNRSVRVGAPANSGAVDSIEPRAQLGLRHPAFGGGDEVADRELVVDELVVSHLDVVREELVAHLVESVGRLGGRVADLRVAGGERVTLEQQPGPLGELGDVDHLADEVVVVQRDPTARAEGRVRPRRRHDAGRTSARRSNTSPRRTTRRERAGAPRARARTSHRARPRAARNISGDTSTPTTRGTNSARATVDMPVPHAMSSARSTSLATIRIGTEQRANFREGRGW